MANLAFFGTPQFSIFVLKSLYDFCLKSNHIINLVVCQPDKPQKRGKKIFSQKIKEISKTLGIKVLTPKTLRKDTSDGDSFFNLFKDSNIDLAIIASYGQIIPKRVLNVPKFGFINLHTSLLPRWRGAAPIHRSIQSGDFATGVCVMDVVEKLDEGDIFSVQKESIKDADTFEKLEKRLSVIGSDLLVKTISKILFGKSCKKKQSNCGKSYAFMVKKEEKNINWESGAFCIYKKAQAFSFWPGVCGYHNGKMLKFYEPIYSLKSTIGIKPGTVLELSDKIIVAARYGSVGFSSVKMEGKNKMPIKSFVMGHSMKCGDVLKAK